MQKRHLGLSVLVGLAVSLAFAAPALAQTNAGWQGRMGGRMMIRPGVFGTVSAVNGTTLTVTSTFGRNGGTVTTYTVDASSATVTKNGASSTVSAIAVGDTVMVQGTVNGTSVTATTIRDGVMMGRGPGQNRGVVGTVASVNGTTLTVTGRAPKNGTATTYTVDASGATVTKNGASSTVSAIAVGDTVMVQGTVNGTSVTATTIRDGMPAKKPQGTPNPVIQGNGEPVVAGSVTAISGSTLTIANKSNITYTIDASGATVVVKGASSSVSNVAVGDDVIVQGTVNGTSVVASSVIDQGGAAPTATTPWNHGGAPGLHFGFFQGIGSFFKHLFGF
ncbi:MAG TPA: DUF5666 domain-containing protein [Candidatus Paceibacterota bacterium]|nr:DUF5666 domain-containing protein [Candidatus Paceibacterota bacterium]